MSLAPSFSSIYVEPGSYPRINPTTQFAVVPGGIRVAAIIGTGATDKPINNELITMISGTYTYTLANVPNSINTVQDANYITYSGITDYSFTGQTLIWLNNAATSVGYQHDTFVGLNGLTFNVTLNGSALSTVTFTVGDTTATIVANDINAATGTSIASVYIAGGNSFVKLTSPVGRGSSIVIGNGTANSILGFYQGATYLGSQFPANNVNVYVTYRTNKVTADYVPTYYSSLNDMASAFGIEDDVTGTLMLGARLAVQNGSSVILAVQLNSADGAELVQFQKAIDKLQTVDCNYIVPMTGNTSIFSYVKAHVDNMSSQIERRNRKAFLGLVGSWTISDIQNIAGGLNDSRIALVYPPSVQMFVGSEPTATSVGSMELAAAIAGLRCNPNYDVAEPMLKKTLVGFSQITDNLTRAQKNSLASSGVMIVDSEGGVPFIRDGLTTNVSTIDSAEFTITDILDYVAQVTQQVTERMYVGTKLTNTTPTQISATVRTLLQQMTQQPQQVLNGFGTISSVQNSNVPTEIDVTFTVNPVRTTKYIQLSFSIFL